MQGSPRSVLIDQRWLCKPTKDYIGILSRTTRAHLDHIANIVTEIFLFNDSFCILIAQTHWFWIKKPPGRSQLVKCICSWSTKLVAIICEAVCCCIKRKSTSYFMNWLHLMKLQMYQSLHITNTKNKRELDLFTGEGLGGQIPPIDIGNPETIELKL